jgi:hypothetical protein
MDLRDMDLRDMDLRDMDLRDMDRWNGRLWLVWCRMVVAQ